MCYAWATLLWLNQHTCRTREGMTCYDHPCWDPKVPQKFRKSHWCAPFTATLSKRRKIGAARLGGCGQRAEADHARSEDHDGLPLAYSLIDNYVNSWPSPQESPYAGQCKASCSRFSGSWSVTPYGTGKCSCREFATSEYIYIYIYIYVCI